jgi:hypothetical protein
MTKKKTRLAILMVVLLVFLTVGTALAITIIVDGVEEAVWTTGSGGQTPGLAADVDEPGITNNGVDIKRIQWTNDQNNLYVLVETWANTDWNRVPQQPYIWLCINNDNNPATGTNFPSVCLSPSGYDRYVQIAGPTPLTVTVYDDAFNVIGATTQAGTAGVITEVAIDLASLGISSLNCGDMPTGIYMDGRTADPDDNVLDLSDVPMTCGGTTAISLQSLRAGDQALPQTVGLIGAALLLLAGASFYLYRRQKQTQG